jgi:hypothetical protein
MVLRAGRRGQSFVPAGRDLLKQRDVPLGGRQKGRELIEEIAVQQNVLRPRDGTAEYLPGETGRTGVRREVAPVEKVPGEQAPVQ